MFPQEPSSQQPDDQQPTRGVPLLGGDFWPIFEQAPIGVVLADLNGRLVEVNPRFCALTGYTREELLKLDPSALTYPDDFADDQRLVTQLFKQQLATGTNTKRYIRKDGGVIWVRVTRNLVRDVAGVARLGLAFVEEITVEQDALALLQSSNEALKRSEAKFAAAFKAGPIILTITRLADGRFIDVNDSFVTHTGYSREEAIGRTPLELGLWVEPARRGEGLAQMQRGQPIRDAGGKFRTKDGAVITCLVAADLIDVDDEPCVLTALTDVTEQVRVEAEREHLAAQLEQERAQLAVSLRDEQRARAEAEAAVRLRDEFLSIASHELNTPLTSLLGTAQLIQRRDAREGALSERDRRSVATVVSQARRLGLLIATLLDVTRLVSGKLALSKGPVDLSELVRRHVEELRTMGRHTLVLALPTEPLLIFADGLRLEQVVANLVQNALKYSPSGTRVTVRLERDSTALRLRVADEGIGIPAAALPSLFTRYYRAPNAAAQRIAGMGIGLYVVREIVELHGGTVGVESEEGRGSVFTVTLPAGLLLPEEG